MPNVTGLASSSAASQAEVLKPQEMLEQLCDVNVCAPMVRYSKLPFRRLVSLYDCHITYTPMLLAQEFSRSAAARESEFTTSVGERGVFQMRERNGTKPSQTTRTVRGCLMAQFAANDAVQLADAAELVRPYVDGIDLNCGCPQKWAYEEGIGSALLRKPDLVRDLVRTTKQRLGWSFPVSVKIRVDNDPSLTEVLVSTAVAAGADILTVHGRTRHQSSDGHPVDLDRIRFAASCTKGAIPVVANGDVFSLQDAQRTREHCGTQGVMSARGLLANPALFSGYETTPLEAVKHFVRIATETSLIFPLFHRHLAYMLEGRLERRRDRISFNSLASRASVVDFLETDLGIAF